MAFVKQRNIWIVPALASAILFSCAKHHSKPSSGINSSDTTSFWNTVAGHYKVYDSTGDFIYEMDIIHIAVDEFTDSLRFENFDDDFDFTQLQSTTNYPDTYVGTGFHQLLYDRDSLRWTLGSYNGDYYNNLINDTIRFHFTKTNIAYWMQDAVTYYSGDIKQIAVKQP